MTRLPSPSLEIPSGETKRKPRQNATTLFAIAAKPLFRGGSSSNSLPFACSSTVKLLSWWLANLSPQKKTTNECCAVLSFLFFFFQRIVDCFNTNVLDKFLLFEISYLETQCCFLRSFYRWCNLFFFFLKVNIYFGARRGEVWKIQGRNLFPECFRTKEKYIRVVIVKRRSTESWNFWIKIYAR